MMKELRHDRHTVSLQTDYLVTAPKYRGKIPTDEVGFVDLKEWYGDHLWSPGCYHGSMGLGWDVVEKYISSQNRSPDKKAL
jgi:REP element-mobilizing transposase RayT